MLGPAGKLYSSPENAAAIIRETESWSDGTWADAASAAVQRAKAFADTAVLPKLVAEWRFLTGK